MTASLLQKYQRIAPFYDWLDSPFERRRYRPIRPLLFEGLSGRLLDVGIGTGRNIPYYPPAASVVGIDRSPAMLARAERRRSALGASVELRAMDVRRLEFPDGSFDAAVASFVFCVLPEEDQLVALKELARVVKSGGAIRLLDTVRPSGSVRGAIARLWEPWMAFAYGAGFDRRTEAHIPEAGLEIASARFVSGDIIRLIEARAQ